MSVILEKIFGRRLWPLFVKELRQIKRNRRLVVSLIIPPTVQLILFGFALNPEVKNLRLGVVDESRTGESRELVSAFVESRSFEVKAYYASPDELGRALSAGNLDAGLVVPEDFARQRERHQTAQVQLIVDAVNANTATIAGGYAARIIAALNQKIARAAPPPAQVQQTSPVITETATASPDANSVALNVGGPQISRASITPRIALLYNPGLQNAWFIVTGTLGTLLVLNGSLVSAASMVKEKEAGTVEQLLMTPAEASEIITAKIAPLFLLLAADVGLALGVGYVVFGIPVRGSLLLLYFAGSLCVLAGIGIGTFLATFAKSQQQAQLMGFFVNPPVALLSGVTTPIEAMPHWLQPFTYLNPVRHFALISRGIMLKGAGLNVLYPNILALLSFATVLVGVSAWRFRKQLG
ncbi:MAG: drug efflux transport system permease protein [Blastocatellia bacterium]|jgi:ABC-2 type transport system permease protein|nr:drug efflux transport system permease protein [Blastocatellia bacterium]